MRLGLYRASSRHDIHAAHALIAERGFSRTADDIRRCRQEIMDLDDSSPARGVVKYQDFFTTSECRDLLFTFKIINSAFLRSRRSWPTTILHSSESRARRSASMPRAIRTTRP